MEANIYMRTMAQTRSCEECDEPIEAGTDALIGETDAGIAITYYHEECGMASMPETTIGVRSFFNEIRDRVPAE